MRYSILGFNQEQVIEQFPEITLDDLLILQYVWNASASTKMEHTLIKNTTYTWIYHKKLLEDLPILKIKEESLKKHFKKLIDLGLIAIIKRASDSCRGTKSFYAITEKTEALQYRQDEEPSVKNYTCSDDQVEKNTLETTRPSVKKYTSDNKLNKNNKLNKYNNIENFGKPTIKKIKENLYTKCFNEIEDFVYRNQRKDIKETLIEYLKVRIKNTDKPLGFAVWKGILGKLEKEILQEDWQASIQQSINRNYASVFAVDTRQKKAKQFDEHINRDGRYDNVSHERTGGKVF